MVILKQDWGCYIFIIASIYEGSYGHDNYEHQLVLDVTWGWEGDFNPIGGV